MKKFIIATLAFIYISSSTGANIYMHYCMGKLADWGMAHNNSKTCGKCGMHKSSKKNNGCCNEEHKFIKNDTDQKIAETGSPQIQLNDVSLPVSFLEIPSNHFASVTEHNPVSHAPPQK